MRSSLVLAALLCFTTWMSMANANHGMGGQWCCIQWSTTRVPVKRIANYTIQPQGACPIAAIIFRTHGRTFCSDPSDPWAQKAMKKVDEEKKKLQLEGQNEEGSTSDITPAASTTSKNGAPKGRKGRKRQRKRSGKGKRGQNKRS